MLWPNLDQHDPGRLHEQGAQIAIAALEMLPRIVRPPSLRFVSARCGSRRTHGVPMEVATPRQCKTAQDQQYGATRAVGMQ